MDKGNKKVGSLLWIVVMVVMLLGCAKGSSSLDELGIEEGFPIVIEEGMKLEEELKAEIEIDREIEVAIEVEEFSGQEEITPYTFKSEQLLMEQYEEVLDTCVTIRCGGYRGEGSILLIEESTLYVVSVKHLLANDTHVEISFYDGYTMVGEVVYLSEQYDFGFVCIQGVEEDWNGYTAVRFPKEDLLTYSHYIVVATLNGREREESLVGSVLDPNKFFPEFNSFMIHHYCVVEPGMSGSGVFNELGEYQGLLVGGLEQESVSLSYGRIEEALYTERVNY
ncbi:MAG: serine protease [Eubacteriales bacterium]